LNQIQGVNVAVTMVNSSLGNYQAGSRVLQAHQITSSQEHAKQDLNGLANLLPGKRLALHQRGSNLSANTLVFVHSSVSSTGPSDAEDEEHQINDIPAPLKDRRRQKEFEIFVGGLDKEADEEDLKKVFGVVGEIKEIRMSKNPVSQKNRGFSFIRYETIEVAKRALIELKDAQVKDKCCGVSPSQDNDTLYLENICKTWTKDAVREKLKEYEIENIEEMALMDDPKNEGQNCGFAFLEFTTHQFAMNAYKRLQK
jgi:RNA recognition motif-containing protein